MAQNRRPLTEKELEEIANNLWNGDEEEEDIFGDDSDEEEDDLEIQSESDSEQEQEMELVEEGEG